MVYPNEPKPSKSDHSKYVYFQPGGVLFVVTHSSAGLSPNDLGILIGWSNERAGAHGLNVFARPIEELVSFPAFPSPNPDAPKYPYEEPAPSWAKGPRIEDLEPHPPFTIILADVKDATDPAQYVDGNRLADFIIELDNSIRDPENSTVGPQLSDGTLEVVSPNWLSSPCSETGGGGGPGSRPVPFSSKTPPGRSEHKFRFATDKLDQDMENLLPPLERRGEGVVVAILDTAPCMHELVAAYERWQKVDPQPIPEEDYPGNPPGPHGLIETLLRPGGPLTVHYASYEELIRMRSVHLKDHNYNMTDHGLFVAGIIHSLAPAAEIHLYEVLNPEGVGDLKSIADGLSKVYKSFPGRRLVVNCSLVLNMPLLWQRMMDLPNGIKAKIIHNWQNHEDHADTIDRFRPELWDANSEIELARQARAIERICNLIYERESRVVAAAGNDWMPGKPRSERPQARYPAAFMSVAGVGALKRRRNKNDRYDPAEYSDQADRPNRSGIMTFGGEKGQKNGVLGVYLGAFPKRADDDDDDNDDQNAQAPQNECDWAWWAGTSFASPIITGLTAAVLSGDSALTTQQAIDKLYEAQVITTSPEGEDILDVTQGPLPS